MTESESVALPLGDTPISVARRTAAIAKYIIMYKSKNYKRFYCVLHIFIFYLRRRTSRPPAKSPHAVGRVRAESGPGGA